MTHLPQGSLSLLLKRLQAGHMPLAASQEVLFLYSSSALTYAEALEAECTVQLVCPVRQALQHQKEEIKE